MVQLCQKRSKNIKNKIKNKIKKIWSGGSFSREEKIVLLDIIVKK